MSDDVQSAFPQPEVPPRRAFLRQAGTLTAASLLLAACGDDKPQPQPTTNTLDVGSGDAGVFTYLFLLERLSADFYQKVLATPPAALSATELAVLRDISRHEIIHRELLLNLFKENSLVTEDAQNALMALEFNYSPFNLTSREGVLTAARTIEDLGLTALCSAAKLVTTSAYLRLISKMAAVEARHAATVRDLLQPGSFAASDVVGTTGADAGLNQLLSPADVLTELSKYTPVPITGSSLPTS